MPLYEYICETCGVRFEAKHGMDGPWIERHHGCGGKVTRVLSVPTLQFKGSGFYATDYRKGTQKSAKNR